jgi:hypothetical protein
MAEQRVLNLKPGIPRVDIRVADTRNLLEELAYDSDVLLGYTVLRKELGLAGPLGRLLDELGIKPYDAKLVEEYKETAKEEKQDELFRTGGYHYHSDVWRLVNWVEHDLRGFASKVPDFALDLARSIAKKSPATTFKVEVLEIRQNEGDPFLWACLGEEKYCIAVWDEPDFEEQVRNG